jgi:hypothetical protein
MIGKTPSYDASREKPIMTSPTEGAQSDWIFDVTPPEVV